MKNTLLYLWQLPQNALGWLLCLYYTGTDSAYQSAIVRRSAKMQGGISLGKYIIVNERAGQQTISHEYGHVRQSEILGWLYLIVVGLPSILHAGWWTLTEGERSYYDFYTERWADKLGGVER